MLKKWIEARLAKMNEARAIFKAAEDAARDLTDEERGKVDGLQKEIDTLTGDITRAQALEAREAETGRSVGTMGGRPAPDLGMNDGEVEQYSIVRAIRSVVDGSWNRNGGLEREASDAVASRLGRTPQGFFVPNDVLKRGRWQAANAERRDLNRGTNSAGGYTVQTDVLASNFIELLRNRLVLQAAGARVLNDLVGDVSIPKQSAAASATWVSETGTVTANDLVFAAVAMAPKTLKARTGLTRRLMLQSSMDVEMLARDDLAAVLARGVDRAGLHGTGASNQPTGVAATSGIGAVAGGTNGAAPTWSNIIDLESKVAIANADLGALSYITSPKVRGKLKQTAKISSTDSRMVWDGNDLPVNGYDAIVTNQVADNLTKGTSSGVCSAIFFGNWNELLIGFWGVLDILVDPYTARNNGNAIIIDAMQDCDIAVRHAESFSAMLDALAA